MNDYSIVIPAYNAEKFITTAINSARGLEPSNIIVVDDGSSDRTADIAQNMNCRTIRQSNSGAARAREAGLRLVETSLVTFLDADDGLITEGTQESLRLARRYLSLNQGFSCIIGATLAGNNTMPAWSDGVSTQNLLHRGRPPGPPAAFVWHTATLRASLSCEPELLTPAYAEDYELVLRGTRTLPVITHSKPCCLYTTTGGKSANNAQASILASEQIRRHYADLWSIPIRQRSSAEIKMLARIRTDLSSYQGPKKWSRIFRHCAVATLSDPIKMVDMIHHRLTR